MYGMIGVQMLLVSSNAGGYVLYDITSGSQLSPLRMLVNGTLSSPGDAIRWSTMALGPTTSRDGFALVQMFGTSTCAINMRVYYVTNNGVITQRGPSKCVQQYAPTIINVSVDIANSQSPNRYSPHTYTHTCDTCDCCRHVASTMTTTMMMVMIVHVVHQLAMVLQCYLHIQHQQARHHRHQYMSHQYASLLMMHLYQLLMHNYLVSFDPYHPCNTIPHSVSSTMCII